MKQTIAGSNKKRLTTYQLVGTVRTMSARNSTATRSKLLDAARDVIRAKGYSATTVDDICATAGVTKGGFFHHFPSKEQLGIAAIEQFGAAAAAIFAAAPYAS